MKKWIIKDAGDTLWYCGETYGWADRVELAETYFLALDAEKIIKTLGKGWYNIEAVYIITSNAKV